MFCSEKRYVRLLDFFLSPRQLGQSARAYIYYKNSQSQLIHLIYGSYLGFGFNSGSSAAIPYFPQKKSIQTERSPYSTDNSQQDQVYSW